jgi:hypothetical protein
MRVVAWDSVNNFEDHPRIVVAKGSHGLGVEGRDTGTVVVEPITQPDVGRFNCGLTDKPAAVVPTGTRKDVDYYDDSDPLVLLGKLVSSTLFGLGVGAIGGPAGAALGAIGGFAVGVGSAISEATEPFGDAPAPPPPPPPSANPQTDTFDATGRVVHPPNKLPGDVPVARGQPWTSRAFDQNNRSYDYLVDREAQLLWPGAEVAFDGFTGRWGQRVQEDSQARRAGMRFPKFWELTFSELLKLP